MDKLKFYLKSGQLIKDKTVEKLCKKYLLKAKNNLTTMKFLSELKSNRKLRFNLNLPENYDPNEWVVICAYYAMYSAALALISKINFRSKNHSATILLLEKYFVKEKKLSKEDLFKIRGARLKKEELEMVSEAKHKREIAQYSITKKTTERIAKEIQKEAYIFVNKCEEILDN